MLTPSNAFKSMRWNPNPRVENWTNKVPQITSWQPSKACHWIPSISRQNPFFNFTPPNWRVHKSSFSPRAKKCRPSSLGYTSKYALGKVCIGWSSCFHRNAISSQQPPKLWAHSDPSPATRFLQLSPYFCQHHPPFYFLILCLLSIITDVLTASKYYNGLLLYTHIGSNTGTLVWMLYTA